ncbi:hypothetical protein [Caulobacter sp. UNC279MFTsu5.1]|uniref:hypothetical protein n=1 Tax=Caulobacter sp. UNC279MFTsu5.1 TaxID=1502775 RepID=UPI002100E7F2|nr:hypothetical protein [Caulobacter sp. UNC279MFTsu5.1]
MDFPLLPRFAALLGGGAVALASPALAQPPLELRLADVGRFATFVDMGGIAWTGRTARLRVLQVTEEGFTAGTEAFWGGWRYEVIDCDARTIAHVGFSSVRAGGREGPVSGDQRPAAAIPPGGADDAAAKVICDGWRPYVGVAPAASVEEAVKVGRPLIATGAEP